MGVAPIRGEDSGAAGDVHDKQRDVQLGFGLQADGGQSAGTMSKPMRCFFVLMIDIIDILSWHFR